MKLNKLTEMITSPYKSTKKELTSPCKQKGFINLASALSKKRGIDRGTYTGKSLVLDGSADYLSWTPSVAGDRTLWAFSIWIKRSELGSFQRIISSHTTVGVQDYLYFTASDELAIAIGNGSTKQKVTTAVYRDTHAPIHIVWTWDSNQGMEEDRTSLYVNGSRITSWSTNSGTITSGFESQINNNVLHRIGCATYAVTMLFNGYIAKPELIDGQALTGGSFGHNSNDTNKWAISDTGSLTYGANGFSLDLNNDRASTPDTTTTIYDQSGNSNNWTGNSLTTDSFTIDTPVNNLLTFNPLFKSDATTYFNGNRSITTTTSNDDVIPTSIPIPTSGKWACKFILRQATTNAGECVGIIPIDASFQSGTGLVNIGHGKIAISSNGSAYNNSTTPTDAAGTYTTWAATNDSIELFFDADTGQLSHKVNGGTLESAITVTDTTKQFVFIAGHASGSATAKIDLDMDSYTPTESDYKALKTSNLPLPINKKTQDNANIVLYTGNGTAIGSGGNSITGVGFQPDFVWMKNRDNANNNTVFDTLRGTTKKLHTDTTHTEQTDLEGLNSFDNDGFTVGNAGTVNSNTDSYWSLNLFAGNGNPVSNTDGSITSSVLTDSENFSIVTYTGTGANATVGHGLSSAPDLIIIKNRDSASGSWNTYHSANTSAPETEVVMLNTTAATTDDPRWQDTPPTSSVFYVSSEWEVNNSGQNIIAYCFVFGDVFTGGSYTGNGNADGTFIPSDELLMTMIKSSSGATTSWVISDQVRSTYNPSAKQIHADLNNAELTTTDMDFVSNGFKLRASGANVNTSGVTYIWFGIKKNGGQLAF